MSGEGEEDREDPFNVALRKTGCEALHYKLQDCFLEHRDWRKCQEEVKEFRQCVQQQNKPKGNLSVK
jgi:cytochrome c oxidase assembly factor 4